MDECYGVFTCNGMDIVIVFILFFIAIMIVAIKYIRKIDFKQYFKKRGRYAILYLLSLVPLISYVNNVLKIQTTNEFVFERMLGTYAYFSLIPHLLLSLIIFAMIHLIFKEEKELEKDV